MLWPFEYYRPETAEEVDRLMRENSDAKLLAGGSNLVIDMEYDLVRPDCIIDIKKVDAANEFTIKSDGPSVIGAAIPINRLMDCSDIGWGSVKEAVPWVASYQVRNRATAVGNFCNGSPAADMAPPFMVLGTKVHIRKTDGTTRSVPLQDFFVGVKKVDVAKDEWVVSLEVEPHGEGTKSGFYKKQRVGGHDLAIMNVAGMCDPDKKQFRISVGACAVVPLFFDFDEIYASASGKDDFAMKAMDKVMNTIAPINDVRGSAEYRREMVKYFTGKLIDDIYC
jgi:carbon-monoxide dehydrogenase medium subunit